MDKKVLKIRADSKFWAFDMFTNNTNGSNNVSYWIFFFKKNEEVIWSQHLQTYLL
jgi:hypothetical protein